MDDKLERIIKSIEDLKRQIQGIQAKVNTQEIIIGMIAKDVGTSDSKNMSDILYKMDGYMSRDATTVQTLGSEMQEIRRATTNIELMVKDIMKGMAVLYNTVDELEENLIPERQTK